MISLKKTFRNEKLISLALAATFIFSSFSSVMLTSCKKGEDKTVKPADYGSYGSDLARKIAADFPDRKPYSEGEKYHNEKLSAKTKVLADAIYQGAFKAAKSGASCTRIPKRN